MTEGCNDLVMRELFVFWSPCGESHKQLSIELKGKPDT